MKCDKCGRFIGYRDFDPWHSCPECEGTAIRRLVTPDSHFSKEEYETLCKACAKDEGRIHEHL